MREERNSSEEEADDISDYDDGDNKVEVEKLRCPVKSGLKAVLWIEKTTKFPHVR